MAEGWWLVAGGWWLVAGWLAGWMAGWLAGWPGVPRAPRDLPELREDAKLMVKPLSPGATGSRKHTVCCRKLAYRMQSAILSA